ncbi:hypothetical protein HK097_002146 [Rhizophlyctis rosea]|uniref:Uncharacterized protein n=1 Tax=Rhizophlyctis rosea TaxID=64517 RepID=A0AAD5SBG7_9FUNG|nr:hypothetical protein HK097_002146 [Rhizophlyctis rosea]
MGKLLANFLRGLLGDKLKARRTRNQTQHRTTAADPDGVETTGLQVQVDRTNEDVEALQNVVKGLKESQNATMSFVPFVESPSIPSRKIRAFVYAGGSPATNSKDEFHAAHNTNAAQPTPQNLEHFDVHDSQDFEKDFNKLRFWMQSVIMPDCSGEHPFRRATDMGLSVEAITKSVKENLFGRWSPDGEGYFIGQLSHGLARSAEVELPKQTTLDLFDLTLNTWVTQAASKTFLFYFVDACYAGCIVQRAKAWSKEHPDRRLYVQACCSSTQRVLPGFTPQWLAHNGFTVGDTDGQYEPEYFASDDQAPFKFLGQRIE